jgi:hypothetical protein
VEPTRARTPYMFFVRDARLKVKEEMPQVPKKDIMQQVGKLWRELNEKPEELAYYQELARKDLERFKLEHAEFVSKINALRRKNLGEEEKPKP